MSRNSGLSTRSLSDWARSLRAKLRTEARLRRQLELCYEYGLIRRPTPYVPSRQYDVETPLQEGKPIHAKTRLIERIEFYEQQR